MVAELLQIAEVTGQTNPYLGRKDLDRLRKEVAKLDAAVLPFDQFAVLVKSAEVELNHGFEAEAVQLLERAMQIVRAYSHTDNRFTPIEVARAVQWLGTAGLRLSEAENCNATPNAESCIYPFSENALHRSRRGAELTAIHLTRLLYGLEIDEYNKKGSIWLLNLAHMALGSYPEGVPEQWRLPLPDEQPPPGVPNFPEFPNVAAEVGLDTFSLAGGVVADDFDGDGDCDVILSSWDSVTPMTYLENDGSGRFSPRDAGLSNMLGGLNLKQADYDNDGDLDLLVLRGAWLAFDGKHPNSLLQNDGKGNFTDVAYAVGLAQSSLPTQTGDWADYDLDGDLDLFLGNETYAGMVSPCELYRNDGGTFTEVGKAAGVDFEGFVKGVTWGDFDNDRYPDIYLSNFGGPNQLYRNRGDGTFEDANGLLGERTGPYRSFPVSMFDYNNDGWLDIFGSSYECFAQDWVDHYRGERIVDEKVSSLFENQQGKGFRDVARERGLAVPIKPMGYNFGDLTNDGYPDMYLGSGTPILRVTLPNALFINDGGQFYDQTATSRMGHIQKGHAIAFFDYDQDGDIDVFEQMGGAVPGDGAHDVLFQNPGFGRHWIKVRLRGKTTNRYGIGCRVGVQVMEESGTSRWIYQWMNSGASFGANPLELHFGLGEASTIERIEVDWPVSGKTQVIKGPEIDRRLVIRER